jgi:hypothetical protein
MLWKRPELPPWPAVMIICRERERGADTDRVKRRYNDKYAHRDSDGARYGDRERDTDGARSSRERDRARH